MLTLFLLLASSFLCTPLLAQEQPASTDGAGRLIPTGWWTIPSVDDRGRRPFRPDAVFARYLLDPASPTPAEGDTLMGELGEEAIWAYSEAEEHGGAASGPAWAYTAIEVAEACVMMARLQGASTMFVNGDGFVGDVYRYGWRGVPVALREGRNDVYVTGIRGGFRFELLAPGAELMIDAYDRTSPHLVEGATRVGPLGLLLVNATDRELDPSVTMAADDLFAEVRVASGILRPLEVTKVAMEQPILSGASVSAEVEEYVRSVSAHAPGVTGAHARVPLAVVQDGPARRETFVSDIDKSVQFYGLLSPLEDNTESPAEPTLVLSLHGAGVNALGQVRSYSRRPGVWIAGPTNRRPFGFDWQDWGRQDAYEVRDLALATTGVDARRVQVTGHSMGGHGAWHLAANDTDGFSAVAPSAGWCSFDTYGGRPAGDLVKLWHAADAPSRTLDLLDGLVQMPTFILHGTGDRNVPVSEAEDMMTSVSRAGGEPRVHLQEGAAHWWDGPAAPGVDCVDWPGIFELFREYPEIEPSARLEWVSAGPGVDKQHYELVVEQVLQPGGLFLIDASLDVTPRQPVFRIRTENVRRLAVVTSERLLGATLEVDGRAQPMEFDEEGSSVWLQQIESGSWVLDGPPKANEKRSDRMGPFKRAFDRGFVFVIGTAGTDEEDAQLLARARYDAQVWWYRGNGRAPLVTDQEFLAEDSTTGNVILFGNATSNSAWDALLEVDCPLRAERGRLSLGEHIWYGGELGAVFVAPRKGDPDGLVGVFADTGPLGTRLGYTLAPFVSGVGYPDYAIFSEEVLRTGDGGVLAAGWWDNSWGDSLPPVRLLER